MSKNLTGKIAFLMQDIEKLGMEDKIRSIERFVTQELSLLEAKHEVSFSSLQQIATRASAIARDLPSDFTMDGKRLTDYPDIFRTLCLFLASYGYFRAEKLTPYLVSAKANKVI